jgi:hypothetical protein
MALISSSIDYKYGFLNRLDYELSCQFTTIKELLHQNELLVSMKKAEYKEYLKSISEENIMSSQEEQYSFYVLEQVNYSSAVISLFAIYEYVFMEFCNNCNNIGIAEKTFAQFCISNEEYKKGTFNKIKLFLKDQVHLDITKLDEQFKKLKDYKDVRNAINHENGILLHKNIDKLNELPGVVIKKQLEREVLELSLDFVLNLMKFMNILFENIAKMVSEKK